jgi:diacylglycerol kinase family enzyme
VDYRSSAGDHWHQALEDPGDLVAVVGGDGTICAVADRLVGRRVPIAVLPLGTANNISNTLGLAGLPLERLIAGWSAALRIGFDAGLVLAPWGMTRFIERIGVGLLALAIARPSARNDIALAHLINREGSVTSSLIWLREQLRDCPAKELKITLDGADLSGEYIMLEVMNIQHIGPSLHIAPDADPGDGLLEVVLVSKHERDKLVDYLGSRAEGNRQPLQWEIPRGQRLQLQWDGSDSHIDDRAWPCRGSTFDQSPIALEVTVDRHALEFLV